MNKIKIIYKSNSIPSFSLTNEININHNTNFLININQTFKNQEQNIKNFEEKLTESQKFIEEFNNTIKNKTLNYFSNHNDTNINSDSLNNSFINKLNKFKNNKKTVQISEDSMNSIIKNNSGDALLNNKSNDDFDFDFDREKRRETLAIKDLFTDSENVEDLMNMDDIYGIKEGSLNHKHYFDFDSVDDISFKRQRFSFEADKSISKDNQNQSVPSVSLDNTPTPKTKDKFYYNDHLTEDNTPTPKIKKEFNDDSIQNNTPSPKIKDEFNNSNNNNNHYNNNSNDNNNDNNNNSNINNNNLIQDNTPTPKIKNEFKDQTLHESTIRIEDIFKSSKKNEQDLSINKSENNILSEEILKDISAYTIPEENSLKSMEEKIDVLNESSKNDSYFILQDSKAFSFNKEEVEKNLAKEFVKIEEELKMKNSELQNKIDKMEEEISQLNEKHQLLLKEKESEKSEKANLLIQYDEKNQELLKIINENKSLKQELEFAEDNKKQIEEQQVFFFYIYFFYYYYIVIDIINF